VVDLSALYVGKTRLGGLKPLKPNDFPADEQLGSKSLPIDPYRRKSMLKSMLQNLRESRAIELEGEGAGEAGFTLIELMVVLLIIAILLAIAIPTFLGVTGGANDRAAQSNLTNAMPEAQAIYQNNGQAFPATAAPAVNYSATAPEFTWSSAASANQNDISVSPFNVAASDTTGQGVALAILSKTGTCWYIVNLQQAPAAGGTSPMTTLMPSAGTFYVKRLATNTTACSAAGIIGATITTAGGGTSYSAAMTVP